MAPTFLALRGDQRDQRPERLLDIATDERPKLCVVQTKRVRL